MADKLTTADASLARAIADGTLKVVAAVKYMHSGEVKFLDLDDAPAPAPEAREPAHA